jgi:hypothetical protein
MCDQSNIQVCGTFEWQPPASSLSSPSQVGAGQAGSGGVNQNLGKSKTYENVCVTFTSNDGSTPMYATNFQPGAAIYAIDGQGMKCRPTKAGDSVFVGKQIGATTPNPPGATTLDHNPCKGTAGKRGLLKYEAFDGHAGTMGHRMGNSGIATRHQEAMLHPLGTRVHYPNEVVQQERTKVRRLPTGTLALPDS